MEENFYIKMMKRKVDPIAWYCPVCKKFDLAEVKKPMAMPEHIPHRGHDIGCCKGKMIPLCKLEEEENDE